MSRLQVIRGILFHNLWFELKEYIDEANAGKASAGHRSRQSELEKMTQSIPTGHFGTPEDVGRLAIFLASPESRFMVGQTLVLDGGQICYFPGTSTFGEDEG